MVGGHVTGRTPGELIRLRDQLFDHGRVESALGRHPGHDADAADRHVGVFVGQEDGRAD